MSKVKVYKDVLTEEEIKYLNNVAMLYFKSGVLQMNGYIGRYSTRLVGADFKFPNRVYAISKKIRDTANVSKFNPEPLRGANGINVSVTITEGGVEEHKDPRCDIKKVIYNCNVITQKSDVGGDLVVEGEVIELEVGDIHCYAVSEVKHLVTASKGATPRVLWMFSTHIPVEQTGEYLGMYGSNNQCSNANQSCFT